MTRTSGNRYPVSPRCDDRLKVSHRMTFYCTPKSDVIRAIRVLWLALLAALPALPMTGGLGPPPRAPACF